MSARIAFVTGHDWPALAEYGGGAAGAFADEIMARAGALEEA